MTIYNFDTPINRQGSDSTKWSHYPPDVLPLWVADMDFISPEPVIQALHHRIEHGVFGYPEGFGDPLIEMFNLRRAIINRLADQYNWQVSPEWIVLIPGLVTGLNQAAHAFVQPDQAVLVQTPVYPPFLGLAKNTGGLRQECELTRQPDGSYSIDFERFEQSITPQTRLFVLCNPHNPVGRAFTRTELEKMAEICLRHDVLMISDEIHCDLIYSGHQHIPLASLNPEVASRSITLMAPSKTYNMAGLQCSFAIIPDKALREQFNTGTLGMGGWVNLLGLTAAEAAYRDGQDWLDQMLTYLQANRDYLHSYVQNNLPGIQMALPEATYLAWLDCRSLNLPGSAYEFFLKEARVALNDGKTFGKPGEGFVRLNFGTPRVILTEALERMSQALKNIK